MEWFDFTYDAFRGRFDNSPRLRRKILERSYNDNLYGRVGQIAGMPIPAQRPNLEESHEMFEQDFLQNRVSLEPLCAMYYANLCKKRNNAMIAVAAVIPIAILVKRLYDGLSGSH